MSPTSLLLMWVGLGALMTVISVPLVLGWVPRNHIYGFRTPKTLSSDAVWYPANRYGGRALGCAGLVSTAGALLLLAFGRSLPLDLAAYVALAVFLVPMLVAVTASLLYVRTL
jgi:uncharacterized membrane protein